MKLSIQDSTSCHSVCSLERNAGNVYLQVSNVDLSEQLNDRKANAFAQANSARVCSGCVA